MTDAKHSTRRIHDYFVRGYPRSRSPLPSGHGQVIWQEERLFAQFLLRIHNGRIAEVRFNCSTCVVLVAYCECLAEMVHGLPLTDAETIANSVLIRAFPEVPASRHDRARLAVEAMHSAVRVVQSRFQDS